MAEATEDVVVQAVMAVVAAVVIATRIRAGGAVEIEVHNRRTIRTDRRAIQIDPRAIQTELKNQGQRATGVRKRDTGSRSANDI